MLQSDMQMFERYWFDDLIQKWCHKIQQTLFYELKSKTKILIVLNNWTNFNHLVFMSVTAYFIDDSWNYWEVFLIFQFFHDQHIDQSITVKLYTILDKYNLTHQLLTVITDNCNNNKFM